jgi:hypothetical protein
MNYDKKYKVLCQCLMKRIFRINIRDNLPHCIFCGIEDLYFFLFTIYFNCRFFVVGREQNNTVERCQTRVSSLPLSPRFVGVYEQAGRPGAVPSPINSPLPDLIIPLMTTELNLLSDGTAFPRNLLPFAFTTAAMTRYLQTENIQSHYKMCLT